MGVGAAGLLADLYSVWSTLALGLALGKWLKMDEALTVLIATGSAICGCSAVAATQPILDAESHHVAAAVGTVVLCGTSAMFIYPALQQAVPTLAASNQLMGIYTGATVHELAGVVAAGSRGFGVLEVNALARDRGRQQSQDATQPEHQPWETGKATTHSLNSFLEFS